MNRTARIILVLGGLTLLAGCGYNKQERATGGAGAGAATGALVGAIAGPPGAAIGAGVGAAAGAATGASTTPQQINLGTPPYNNPNVHVGDLHAQ